MGCDIHMFAERYSTENNRWEKVGNEFIDFYSKNICKGSIINPGVIDYLNWCKDQNLHLAVCTNKMEHLTIKLLKEIKLYDYFDFIAGADTFN